ncbi:MAG: GNAT family N-acetyltransferase [Acidimicrobiales bacterium]
MVDPVVRTLRDNELVAAARIVNRAMLGSVTDEVNEGWASLIDPARALGAFSDTGELVGLARDFDADLCVPGGGDVPAAGVTAVGVLSHHRRQGHLTRLMDAQLRAMADRGSAVGLLVAAEWPIYGRYGYGPAIDACGFDIDARNIRFVAPPTGSIDVVMPEALRPELERVHERRRSRTPGSITRVAEVWDAYAGVRGWPGQPHDPGPLRGALWRDEAGEVQGAVAYKVIDGWDRNRPAGRAEVTLLVGATPVAERELWRHLCEIDWVATVTAGNRGVDDPLQLMLADGRSLARVDVFDCIWARILDVPAALGARRAAHRDRVVAEVGDPQGFASGRWSIELAPDGAEVKPSDETADVALPVHALGAAYLGGRSVRRLHEAGWVDEAAPGGVDRLDALLSTATAPWSITTF